MSYVHILILLIVPRFHLKKLGGIAAYKISIWFVPLKICDILDWPADVTVGQLKRNASFSPFLFQKINLIHSTENHKYFPVFKKLLKMRQD